MQKTKTVIKRSESGPGGPYDEPGIFTMTAELRRNDGTGLSSGFAFTGEAPNSWGMLHELIALRFPEMEKFLPLHLSDPEGKPMHAHANALYWVNKVIQNQYGERYVKRAWKTEKYDPNPLEALAHHLRITENDAQALVIRAKRFADDGKHRTVQIIAFCILQEDRWKDEARECEAWFDAQEIK